MAEKEAIEGAKAYHQRLLEEYEEEIEKSEAENRPEMPFFYNSQESRRLAEFHQSRIDEEYRILSAGARETTEEDITRDKICAICRDYFELNQPIFGHTTAEGVEHIFHNICVNRYTNDKLAHQQIFRCPTCMDPLQE